MLILVSIFDSALHNDCRTLKIIEYTQMEVLSNYKKMVVSIILFILYNCLIGVDMTSS